MLPLSMRRLLRPASIAVIGGGPAAEVIRQNDRLGFAGAIWPVHPTHASVVGRPAFRSVAELPGVPDAVFLATNRRLSIDLVAQLASRGAGGVVCYAAGFAEAGDEGRNLQQQLCQAAGGMALLGPNCYGLLNYLDGAALWPDQHGGVRVARGVAIVTQSGNIACNLTMQRRNLPIAYVATLGNQAQIGLSSMLAALARDSRITAIGLHIEAIDDAAAFAEAVAGARRAGIPVAAIKTGASEAGAALTVSHTASMAGADAVVDAFLARVGIARVRTIPELLETLKLLHVHGTLDGSGIVSMSCSGGEAALMADLGARRRIGFPAFTPQQNAAITATVPALVSVSNPFDYHTFSWADRAALAAIFTAVMRCDQALTALILDFPRADRASDADWGIAADALADAARQTGGRAAIVATMPEGMPESWAERLLAQGIVPLCGMEEALAAIEAATFLAQPPTPPPLTIIPPRGAPRTLDEFESKRLLAAAGVAIPAGVRAEAGAEPPAYPAAVKALGVAHKTERAAVRLHLADRAAVDAAAEALAGLGCGLLIEAMVADPVAEVIVGVARDPALGPYLLLGSGGVLAELVGDRVILMLPASEDEIRAALLSLKVAALLHGFRGRPPGSIDAAVAAIAAIQRAAIRHLDRLLELDVNPLIVTATSAVAADALIRLAELPAWELPV